MADSIFYNVMLSIAGRLTTCLVTAGYNTNIGQRVAIGKIALSDTWSEGVVIIPPEEERVAEYSTDIRLCELHIEAMYPAKDPTMQISPPLFINSFVSAALLKADVEECLTADTLQVQFDTGVLEPSVGDTIEGASSAATGYVESYTVNSGTWGAGTAAGAILLRRVSGEFVSGETLELGGNPSIRYISSTWLSWWHDAIESLDIINSGVTTWTSTGESISQVVLTMGLRYRVANGNPYIKE